MGASCAGAVAVSGARPDTSMLTLLEQAASSGKRAASFFMLCVVRKCQRLVDAAIGAQVDLHRHVLALARPGCVVEINRVAAADSGSGMGELRNARVVDAANGDGVARVHVV